MRLRLFCLDPSKNVVFQWRSWDHFAITDAQADLTACLLDYVHCNAVEMDVAPDGSAVAFCLGQGHMAMGLAVLQLEPPAEADGLPRVVGEPRYVVPTTGTWHVHNGGWSADSKQLVYTQD